MIRRVLCAAAAVAAAAMATVAPVASAEGLKGADQVSANLIEGYYSYADVMGAAAYPPSRASLDRFYEGLRLDLARFDSRRDANDVAVLRDEPLRVDDRREHVRVVAGFTGQSADTHAQAFEAELQRLRDGQDAPLIAQGTYLRYILANLTASTIVHSDVYACGSSVFVSDSKDCPKSGGGGGGSKTGTVVGAVFGVIFGVAIVAGGLVWWRRRSEHRRNLEYTLQGDGLLDDTLGGGYQPPRHTQGSFADFEDLPPGWIQQVDDHGNIYYYNQVTDMSQWELPTA